MVQIIVNIPGNPQDCPEWALLDMQGCLETRNPVPLSGNFIGDLHFTKKNAPILIVGHHIMYGKVVELEKPYAVIVKKTADTILSPDKCVTENLNQISYHVKAIIKRKIIFKQRPKPIIANVPKKL